MIHNLSIFLLSVVRLDKRNQNCLGHFEEIIQADKGRQTFVTHDAEYHTRQKYKGLCRHKQEITNSAWVLGQKWHTVRESQDDWKQNDKYTALPRSTLGFSGLEVVRMAPRSITAVIWASDIPRSRQQETSNIQPASALIDGLIILGSWWMNSAAIPRGYFVVLKLTMT